MALAIIIVTALTGVFITFLSMLRTNGYSDIIRFDEGWTISYNDKKHPVDNIANYTVPEKVKNGDSIFIEAVVPPNAPAQAVLRLRSDHNVVVVFENDELIYKYDIRMTDMNFIGSGYHYVYLNSSKGERRIKIAFVEQTDNRKVTLYNIQILQAAYALSDYSARNIFSLITGMFLVLFGILVVIISVVTRFYGVSFYRTLMIGLLSFFLGTWTLCYTKVIQIVSYNFGVNNSLEYLCLYAATLPFTFLIWRMHKDQLSKIKNIGFILLLSYQLLFTVITSILHTKCIVYYPRTLMQFHISVLVAFLYFIFSGVLINKKMDQAGRILTNGLLIFGLFAVGDLIRFYVCRTYSIENPILNSTWVPIGTLLFVLFLVRSYIVHLIFILEDRAEKSVLAIMAYKDALTGLYNRAKSQQVFEVLDQSDADYAIVSIDLNGLKIVNDKYKHNAGDNLIKTFAQVFKEAFDGIGTPIRAGGDEFTAIIRTEHLGDIDSAFEKMQQLQKEAEKTLPIPLEAAYGIAYKHELTKTDSEAKVEAEKVFQLADERMYTMKAAMKSNLVRK